MWCRCEANGAQDRSILAVFDDPSTGSTKQMCCRRVFLKGLILLFLGCAGDAQPQQPAPPVLVEQAETASLEDTARQVLGPPKVNIFYMRHAQSVPNAIKERAGKKNTMAQMKALLQSALTLDPSLSEKGIKACKQLHQKINDGTLPGWPKQIHLVLSSALWRAIATSAIIFPAQRIYPFPFLKEKSPGLDNWVSDIPTQGKKWTALKEKVPAGLGAVDYQFVRNKDHKEKFTEAAAKKASLSECLKLLGKHLEDLVDLQQAEVNIVLTAHSIFLLEELLAAPTALAGKEKRVKPHNNGIVKVSYDYDAVMKTLTPRATLRSFHDNTNNDADACMVFDGAPLLELG